MAISMKLVRVVALGVFAWSSLACGPRKGEPSTTPEPSTAPVAPVSRAMLSRGGGGTGSFDAIDRLFEAPEVSAAGEKVLERLGSDPALEPLYSGFIAGMLEQPALTQAMVRLAQKNPDLSMEQLAAQVETRLGEGVDSPAFDTALDQSLDRLLDRPDVDAAFERLADDLLTQGQFVDTLAALLIQWQPDLEAAVGVPMTDPGFEARFEAHLAQPGRSEALESLLEAHLVDSPAVRQGLVALIEDQVFYDACAELIRSLLTSPRFDADATAVFAAMIEGVPEAELHQRVDTVLVNPQTEAMAVKWVDQIRTSPAFGALAQGLGDILRDPAVQAELHGVLIGPPARQTA